MPSNTVELKGSVLSSGADAYDVAAGDNTLIVDAGVFLSASNGYAGIGLHGSNHLTLHGTATGSYGVDAFGGGNFIDVFGTASGLTAGVRMGDGAEVLRNWGMISGNDAGVAMLNAGTVENHGTIQGNQGGNAAIFLAYAGLHTVNNSGTIKAVVGFAVVASNGGGGGDPTVTITNTGTITGNIALLSGNDKVDTAGGAIQGMIDLGAGDDTAYGSAAADSILGGDNNDRLIGNNGYDTLVGGENDDTMDGGYGKDRLDGGTGVDAFRFSTAPSPSNVDLIVGFSHTDDRIQLDSSIFTTLGGVVTNSEFHINAHGHGAGTSLQRLILDDSTHTLWYDDDGNGAHAAVQVCGFSGMVGTLAFDDFVI